jgi:hypothetical protein
MQSDGLECGLSRLEHRFSPQRASAQGEACVSIPRFQAPGELGKFNRLFAQFAVCNKGWADGMIDGHDASA